jgi:predicted dehydrogenase
MNDAPLRVGAIGTGNVFNRAHVPALAAIEDVRLAALYDPAPAAAERARSSYLEHLAQSPGASADPAMEITVCDSPEELLELVDLVDICTPARGHSYYAAMALECNVHAMTEKPMARTWWEAQHTAKVAGESSALFQLNDDNVFLPRYRTLRNILDAGTIGDVQTIWIARGSHGPENNPWFWQPQEGGGGCIMDYGTHAVTSVWFLIGYDKIPAETCSLGLATRQRTRLIGGRFRRIEIDDDAHFKVRFVDPVNGHWITAVIEATWSGPELGAAGDSLHGYIHIRGSTGTITGYTDEQSNDFLHVSMYAGGDRYLPVESVDPERESFQAAIDNFVRCIREGVESILNEHIGVGVMSVLNGAQLSELRGRHSVTPEAVADFSSRIAGDAPDPWLGGDLIIAELSKPYRAR